MDFESPDEIERSYNKRPAPAAQKPPEYESPKKTPKLEEVYYYNLRNIINLQNVDNFYLFDFEIFNTFY